MCYADVGGRPWYGGNVGCGLYTMQLTDDWAAKGWTIGASYCDRFHDDTGGTYVAVGGWFNVKPSEYLGFLYCAMFGYFASNLRVGAWNCDYTWTSISGLTYLGVGGWLDYHYLGHNGISALFSNRNFLYIAWDIGACDLLWRTFSGLRYTLYGGKCSDDVFSGWSCLFSSSLSEDTSWGLGA